MGRFDPSTYGWELQSVLPVVLTERQQRARRVAQTGSSVPISARGHRLSPLSTALSVLCCGDQRGRLFSAQT
jgi:hypothetical protein